MRSCWWHPSASARWSAPADCGHPRRPAVQRLIGLVAALSARQELSVGCYCEDESRCHRSVLGELLRDAGAVVATPQAVPGPPG
jgi:hypothetical protein